MRKFEIRVNANSNKSGCVRFLLSQLGGCIVLSEERIAYDAVFVVQVGSYDVEKLLEDLKRNEYIKMKDAEEVNADIGDLHIDLF